MAMAHYIIYKTLGKLKVQNQDVPKTEIDLLTNNFEMFLGPQRPQNHAFICPKLDFTYT